MNARRTGRLVIELLAFFGFSLNATAIRLVIGREALQSWTCV